MAQPNVPKGPKVPADMQAPSSTRGSERTPPAGWQPPELEDEDRTRTYSAETVDKLLHGDASAATSKSSAADEVTRIGEIPIEEIIRAQAPTSNSGVGYEDVTRVYELPKGDAKSEDTSPNRRAFAAMVEPRVIIRPDAPKARWGWWIACALIVATAGAGWVYRTPISKQARQLHANLLRGTRSEAVPAAPKVVAEPPVTISVSVTPADARLTLDGAPVTNPFSVQRPSDKTAHTLVAEAAGYASLRRTVHFERDLTVVLALAPLPAQPAPTEATKAAAEGSTAIADAPVRPRRAAAPPPAKKAAPAQAEPKPGNCNPPYDIDESGVKTYKPECL